MKTEKASPQQRQEDAAEALRRRAADWAAGATESKALDRRMRREQSGQERLDSGRELVELAGKLQRPS